jgi:hypothetical protein
MSLFLISDRQGKLYMKACVTSLYLNRPKEWGAYDAGFSRFAQNRFRPARPVTP